jgi:hypothetical protein
VAAAIDFGADGVETCIEDIEELIAAAEGRGAADMEPL